MECRAATSWAKSSRGSNPPGWRTMALTHSECFSEPRRISAFGYSFRNAVVRRFIDVPKNTAEMPEASRPQGTRHARQLQSYNNIHAAPASAVSGWRHSSCALDCCTDGLAEPVSTRLQLQVRVVLSSFVSCPPLRFEPRTHSRIGRHMRGGNAQCLSEGALQVIALKPAAAEKPAAVRGGRLHRLSISRHTR